MSRSFSGTMLGLDVLKAVSAQLIVLHHLALYGPMPDAAWPLAPDLLAWLANHAKLAVQVFIVLAGFLAAHRLAPDGQLLPGLSLRVVARRYLRLALPFSVAILCCMLCSALVRGALDADLVPQAPGALQFLAHVFLVHDLVGVDALSAGAWYVAIDLQLFVLFLALMYGGKRLQKGPAQVWPWGPLLVFLAGLCGFFYFNLDAGWDAFGVYFFGAYALGVFARWALNDRVWRRAFMLLACLAVAALLLDFRSRLLLALLTSCGVLAVQYWRPAPLLASLSQYFARTSYALFLTHFSVLLLINMLSVKWFDNSEGWNFFGLIMAWLIANVVAHGFHVWVEIPAMQWVARVQPARQVRVRARGLGLADSQRM